MLTRTQIKSLQAITDPLVKKRYLKYFQLPQDLQQIMFNEETSKQIQSIARGNELSDDQLWWASHTVGMVVLGEINIVDFVKTLQEKCKLTEEPARQLARNINQSIFLPVKESLKKIHKVSNWPREDKPEEESTINEPQLDGNVVNLKKE